MANQPRTTLIKGANSKVAFNVDLIEQLERCMCPDTGARYFLENFYYITHPTRGAIKFEPYDYQKRMIDAYNDHRLCVAMAPRQMGKTTVAGGFLLWYAMFRENSTILVAAHKYLGAREIMTRIKFGYESCPDHIRCGIKKYNEESIIFDNGSRILAQTTTSNTGRGMSITMLYCLDGDSTKIQIRNKVTQVEEEVTMKDLYLKCLKPERSIFEDSE